MCECEQEVQKPFYNGSYSRWDEWDREGNWKSYEECDEIKILFV